MCKETKLTPTTFSRNRSKGPPASSHGGSGGECAPQAFFVRIMPQTKRQHRQSNKITLPQHSLTSGCRQVKARQVPLAGRLNFIQKIGKN